MTGRPAARTRPSETEPKSPPRNGPWPLVPVSTARHRPLLAGNAGERLGRIAVLDVHPHHVAFDSRGQRLRVAHGAPAVIGAVVADQDGTRRAQRRRRADDDDRAGRGGREGPGYAAVEEAPEPLARRGPGHQQRGVASRPRAAGSRVAGQPAQHPARDVRVRERRERRLEVRTRGVLGDLLLDLRAARRARRGSMPAPCARQRGKVVVVHDVHELQRRAPAHRPATPRPGRRGWTARRRRTRRGRARSSPAIASRAQSAALETVPLGKPARRWTVRHDSPTR